MSVCNCPRLDLTKYKELVNQFLHSIAPDGSLAQSGWSLLTLMDMYEGGNSLEEIKTVVPFRSSACTRTNKCCGVCTRQCLTRCPMDCLHRLHMWTSVAMSETEDSPLNFQILACTKFHSYEELSYTIGDVLSPKKNRKLEAYMAKERMLPQENPYKIDYAPQVVLGPDGKRVVNRSTGEIQIEEWPKSGLCPYCLPDVTIDTRYGQYERKRKLGLR